MKILITTVRLIIIFFFSELYVHAQVTAKFTMDNPAGCTPSLKVVFTNQSSEGTNIVYSWDFGNGNHSTLKDPSATYSLPMDYTVTLEVTDTVTDESAIISKTVTVYNAPAADFSVITKGCVPYTAEFTDISQEGDTAISEWNWDFRTGIPSTEQNPTHVYTSTGLHEVFLQVTDLNGCQSTASKNIDVANPPAAAFTANPSNACETPASIQFTNNSTGPGTLTYLWVFADGDSSELTSPSHTYNQYNSYNVKLEVTSDYGCSASTSSTVTVSQVIAQGTLTQGGNPIPDTICPGTSVNYNSTSTGTSSVQWVYTGTSSGTFYGQSGSRTFSPGSYTLKLIAAYGTPCADTVSWNFTVENVQADFTMSETNSCTSPVTVDFTDNSTNNVVSWEWTFDDGSKATTQNTQYTFSVPSDPDPYKINTDKYFVTSLAVTSARGCTSATSTKSFRIKKPTAMFTVDTAMGCKSLPVNFTDVSLSDESITNREWIFDDGTTLNTSTSSTLHTFTNDGTFNSRLVITNSLGCTDTSYSIAIKVGKTLSPDFTLSTSNVCPNETIQFTDNTPESNLIQSWHYFVNGQSVPSSPDEPNPYWKVDATPGNNDVRLVVDYNGCISETTKPNALFNKGSLSAFTYNFSCNDPYVYHFTDQSINATSFEWRFGDGATDNSTTNPTHTYAKDSNFIAELVTSNNGCFDTSRIELKVRQPHAEIVSDTTACANTPVIFDASGSYSELDYCYEKYYWDFGSLAKIRTNDDQVPVTFPSRGMFTGMLIAKYDNGCADTAYRTVHVYQPYAGFKADTLLGCTPFEVNFMDTSKADVNPIESWYWNFAYGSDTSYTTYEDTVNRLFDLPGTYPITLTVTDTMGCAGSFVNTIATANPNAQFFADKTNACVGDNIQFSYSYLTGDSVIWDFGDGNISRSSNNPMSHAFSAKGDFPVSLTIYENGCPNTYSSPTDYIKLQKADASFTVSDSVWNCYPKVISFTYSPSDPIVQAQSHWEYGYNNNTGPYTETPQFNYPLPGDYISRLFVETTFGCRDTSERKISLSGPTGNFNMLPVEACRGDSITFSIKDTNDVHNFEWDMGNGEILQGDPVKYVYSDMGEIYPKLILYGEGDCHPSITDTLLIYNVKAAFNYTDTALCDQYNIGFTNNSIGNDNNSWDFGNDSFSSQTDPVTSYNPGNYTVTLQVSNDFGCIDTLQKSFVINPLPMPQLSSDTVICRGTSAAIFALGGDLVNWLPVTGLNDPATYLTQASPLFNTTYTAYVTDTSTGCRNTGQVSITVQQPPDISLSPYPDTTIIIGETVSIAADSSSEFTYNWSPDYQLSCINCASPLAQPLQSTLYTLEVNDKYNCFSELYNLNIDVTEAYSLELPSAFTPNDDGYNDVIYVKGWGIKKLIEYSVYNRWGNRVFFTDDIRQGWDGKFNGKPQSIDTYVYVLKAEMWDGNVVEKKGTFNLLK